MKIVRGLSIALLVIVMLAAVIAVPNVYFYAIGKESQTGNARGYDWSELQTYDSQVTQKIETGDKEFKILILTDIHRKNHGTFAAELGINYLLDFAGELAVDKLIKRTEPDLILVLGEKHYSATPESMEYFGQNFGYVLYVKTLKGKYAPGKLFVEGAHDIVYVRINGRTVKMYDRSRNGSLIHNYQKKFNDGFYCRIPAVDGEMKIEILVEGMGRVNYGPETENDRKGIQKVRLNYQTLFGWDVYCLPMDNLERTNYSFIADDNAPSVMQGIFKAEKGKDCFVDTKGFSKGFVLINGFNIGRYWKKGPQRTLYVPAPLLKDENVITVVEQERYLKPEILIGDKHRL